MKPLEPDDLIAVAARFGDASGRRTSSERNLESLPGPGDLMLGTVADADPDAMSRPEITPTQAKGPVTTASDRVSWILRDAAARTHGKQIDIRGSISRERIIGRGDLQDVAYLEVGIAIARGVARIRIGTGSGTGSLIGPRILMTNHHVISAVKDLDATARAEFDVQDDCDGRPLPRQIFALDPSCFWFTSKDLDVTLIGIAERSEAGRPVSSYPWTRISAADTELVDRDALTIIQHPLGGMKQIALRNNDVILVNDLKDFLHYTTDTQQGSSGSPCFDDLWRLVALHHSGVPARNSEGAILTRDHKVYRRDIHRADSILWIANEGARMSAIEPAIRAAKLASADMERLRAEFLDELKLPNPVVLARQAAVARPPANEPQPETRPRRSRTMSAPSRGGMAGLSIVVNVSGDEIRAVHIERGDAADEDAGGEVRIAGGAPVAPQLPLGPAHVGPAQAAAAEPGDEAGEAIVIDPDWVKRKGYEPDFLGETIPLPTLGDEQKKLSLRVPDAYRGPKDDPYVFKYHHYSLAFNKRRHIAWYSAANIDGGQRSHKYARERDRWFFDPRMDPKGQSPVHQLGEPLYSASNTDRGHLTRYLDVQWGATLDETRKATNDSFHFSNCALQVSGFNQGKDRWQGIERYLLEEKARKEKRRMIVITGPVLRRSDPLYRTEDMEQAVRIPLSFWKLAAIVPQDDRPIAATAFVLGQPDAADLDDIEEKFDVTAVQITVAKLAKLTGFTFPNIVLDNDNFAKKGPGVLEAIGLTRYEDIVV